MIPSENKSALKYALAGQDQFIIGQKSGQTISPDGKIQVPRRAWLVRISALLGIIGITVFNIYQGVNTGDFLVIYATVVLIHSILILSVGWFFFRSPRIGNIGDDLVSVIIPVYNQKGMIRNVIGAIYRSTYQNIEVIAVNDGSKDGTTELLDDLMKEYPSLRVIHKANEGKRKAVAKGFNESKGSYVILIDSDSIVDEHAIDQLVRAFNSDSRIGGVVGHAKVWNANKNTLTRCQDSWYDYAFNMYKTCESTFGCVTCCSGCLAGYRREAVAEFIPRWAESAIQYSDDRALTSFAIGSKQFKKDSVTFSGKLEAYAAGYDDAEDRVLTVQSLVEWKTVYVASAVVYTDAPETLKGYLRQQQRWKKGYIRSNFFASVFFWRKHPLMALIFYTDFMATFTLPLIIYTVLIHEPFVLRQVWTPLSYLAGLGLMGLAQGLDYKFRDPTTVNWKYKPLMNLISTFLLSWLLFPSILTLKKNQWLTR